MSMKDLGDYGTAKKGDYVFCIKESTSLMGNAIISGFYSGIVISTGLFFHTVLCLPSNTGIINGKSPKPKIKWFLKRDVVPVVMSEVIEFWSGISKNELGVYYLQGARGIHDESLGLIEKKDFWHYKLFYVPKGTNKVSQS